jgi:rhodanese-related sulfurtransferase
MVDRLPADKSTLLLFYCGGVDCMLSHQSAFKAEQLGYGNVLTYPEGHPQWAQLHGAATQAAAPAAAAAPVAARLVPGKEKGSVTVASFEQVWREAPASILLVDVRDPKEFAAGTIQGAVNLPIGELEKKVGTLPADKPVVFFCGSGARSGEAYDTVKLLRAEVVAYFIDADAKFNGDGGFRLTQK